MANYRRTQKRRQLETQMEVDFLNKLNEVKKDLDIGIIPFPVDTRTKQDKLQDKSYRDQQIRTMAYNLFDNDTEYSETFINTFNRKQIPFTKFSSVYDELVKRFKNTDARPAFVISTAEKLINNLVETGNTSGGFNNGDIKVLLSQVKQELKSHNFKSKYQKSETEKKLNALEYLSLNIFDKDVFDKNGNEIDDRYNTNLINDLKKANYQTLRNNSIDTLNKLNEILTTENYPNRNEELVKTLEQLRSENIVKIAEMINNGEIDLK